jgi:hypothetical protein
MHDDWPAARTTRVGAATVDRFAVARQIRQLPGKIDEIWEKVADFCERETQSWP